MPDLDLLVPAALVDPALAADLLRDRPLPNLARLLARSGSTESFTWPPQASTTAWQAWVFGHRAGVDVEQVNVAELWAMACGFVPSARGGRYMVEPAHFKIANDHLRLDDPAGLDVTLAEARALAGVIEPLLVEDGWRLDSLEPATRTHWMLWRDDAPALSAPAIERAIGDNVAAWQPRSLATAPDGAALAWRRCVNEIQMLWFGHPINETREAAGRVTVNTLWMSGNGAPASTMPRYAAVDTSLPLLAALPIDPAAGRVLETFDGFVGPARRDDWSGWCDQLAAFDERIGDALRRRADGAIGTVALVLCGRDQAKVATLADDGLRGLLRGWLPGRAGTSLAACFAEGPLA